MAFVHLHVHTQYSLLQGAIHLNALLDRVKHLGMSAVAITDMHSLFGAIDFYLKAKKAGIKPILGCEIFYAPQGRYTLQTATARGGGGHTEWTRFHHLVLLCKNLTGYQNLCQMITRSYTETIPPQKGEPSGPRAFVDRELLSRYGDGLIVLSGCLRGELPYQALMNDEVKGIESLQWFKKRFGDDFFLELQDTALPEQVTVNEILRQWGDRYQVPCVATADCHYLNPEDAEAHEVLQCIENGKTLHFDRPKSLVPAEYYFKSEQTMRERFEHFPKACDWTTIIADRCCVEFRFQDEQGHALYHLPVFRPDGVDRHSDFDLPAYFQKESHKGLELRWQERAFGRQRSSDQWPELMKIYQKRLNDELEMIIQTGFTSYFLIVADFINWSKRKGIPVGPGRGSGAGSLVAYALKITDIDPIQFQLLFERFINPERISMPDFDIDFCQERRGEVIEYVSKKYGVENVCQMITFGKLQARAVIKDVGRVFGLSFATMDQITKLLPDELDITIDRALEIEPRLRERMASDAQIAQVIQYARSLEGLYRNAGVHAAGVIITENPVVTYCPLYLGKDGALVTQFDKESAEAIGLIKFDFLGLKTLTVIDHAIQLIHQVAASDSFDAQWTLDQMNYEDGPVFALISSGDTDGVFQVESSGMKDLCTRIQPNSLEDLTAINALYRPGPLGSGMVDDFIDRKHGRQSIVYEVMALESILKETYGVILYQEQVMQIARELAGYSLGQADLLRRAMGKKKQEEMAKHREIFIQGAVVKGFSAEKAMIIFDLMAKFAQYGFNKSHSAAYGVLTYQTAYLKTHYPSEFMAALMTTEIDNTDKISKYIGDARQHGICVLPPDVNQSQKKFNVEWIEKDPRQKVKAIRFGLEAIKGVGGVAVDMILGARMDGKFKDILDFLKRVSIRKVNKKVLESLAYAGALDSISEVNRASLCASFEALLDYASHEQAERELGQVSFFDALSSDEVKLLTPMHTLFKNEAEWPVARKLRFEKEVVGFYISGHPMDAWQSICEKWLGWSSERLKTMAQARVSTAASETPPSEGFHASPYPSHLNTGPVMKTSIQLAGVLSELKEVMTKKGHRMAFGVLEDQKGKIEVIFFPETYTSLQEMIQRASLDAEPVILGGEVDWDAEVPKILVKTLEWAAEVYHKRVQKMVLRLILSEITADQLREVQRQFLLNRGHCPVWIEFDDPLFRTQFKLSHDFKVSATPQMVQKVNEVFGKEVVWFE